MFTAKYLQSFLDSPGNSKRLRKMRANVATGTIAFTRREAARALDAMMVIEAMVALGDIAHAEDGSEQFSFPLSALIGDILSSWGAESENDEDEGLTEDCGRTLPSELPSRLSPVPAWRSENQDGRAVKVPAPDGAPARQPPAIPGFVWLGARTVSPSSPNCTCVSAH